MNVVDSSAWLECFADGPNAQHFSSPIEQPEALLVPSITIFEVFKCVPSSATRARRCSALR